MLRPARVAQVIALVPPERRPPAPSIVDRQPEDPALVDRARRGDRAAGEALYARHARYIGGMIVRLMRGADDADDVIQDTFVIALNELDKLRDDTSFRAWLAQIAVSQIHRRYRRGRLRRALGFERTAYDRDDATFLQTMATPDAPGEVRAELALLDRALGAADADARIAWMLRFVEGASLDEVARLCNCSLATAKRRIAAAAQTISAAFGRASEDGR